MRRLATPEARGALPRPRQVRSSAAAWGGSFRNPSRHVPRSEARLRDKALPRRLLIHTGPGGGRGVRRDARGLRRPPLGSPASWDGRPMGIEEVHPRPRAGRRRRGPVLSQK
eukprot:14898554-Alexandrium_andersonii.AAC.1